MKNYAVRRLLQLIPILLAITFLSYGMMRIAGSDVIEQKMENTGETLSQEIIDAAREELGLDKPFVVQYFSWLGNLLRGDMGTSYVSNKPVFSTFVSKLPATLLLTVVSILLTVVISIPLGIWAAVKQNKATDYVIRTASFIGNSLPNFFVSPAADVPVCHPAGLVSGHLQGHQPPERGAAGLYAGHRHVRQVSAAGAGDCS